MGRPVSRKKLLRLRDSGRIVLVERGLLHKRAERLRGYVVGVGRDWLVLLTLDGVHFDGWNALRLTDISRVHAHDRADDDFVARAEHVRGPFPEAPEELIEGVDGGQREALHFFLSAAPLVGLRLEKDHPDEWNIGRYEGASPKWVAMREIDPQGRWHADDSAFKRRRISRVTVGGRYLDALIEFGDEPPET
jgi:hypothetical protein